MPDFGDCTSGEVTVVDQNNTPVTVKDDGKLGKVIEVEDEKLHDAICELIREIKGLREDLRRH